MKNENGVLGMLEFDFTIRQVETHLVFGPISRRLPLWYTVTPFCILLILTQFHFSGGLFEGNFIDNYAKYNTTIMMIIIAPILTWQVRKLTVRQQAILGWMFVKIITGLVSFIVIVTSSINILRGQPDAIYLLLIGMLWMPGIEFIPKFTPRQKYISLARIILTLP